MRIELNGPDLGDLDSLLAGIASEVGAPDAYFGWDLHSLRDCLHGGYGGAPPFHIVVRNAEPMIEAFGHAGLVRYCDTMLAVIAKGGRGLVDEASEPYWRKAREDALAGQGPTLLDLLVEAADTQHSTIVFLDDSGREIHDEL